MSVSPFIIASNNRKDLNLKTFIRDYFHYLIDVFGEEEF